MARMMLQIGDIQVSVQPVPGSISTTLVEWARSIGIPTSQVVDHPLFAGDHEVTFFETDPIGREDHYLHAITSEVGALNLVAKWIMVDEGADERNAAIDALREAFGAQEFGWLLP